MSMERASVGSCVAVAARRAGRPWNSRDATQYPSPMSTPAQRTAATPATPSAPVAPATPIEPLPVVAPLGWILIVAASVGIIVATWVLYPIDGTGMWAGYRDGFMAAIALVCAMALNTTLPKRPFLGLIALCGVLMVLTAVFLDDPTVVVVTELAGGSVLIAGALLYGAGDRG